MNTVSESRFIKVKEILLQHLLAIAVIFISGLIVLGGDDAGAYFCFDRPGIKNGEYWRVITAHVTHLSASHWLLNAMGWLLVWGLFRPMFTVIEWIVLLIWSSLIVSAGLYFFNPDLIRYVGLSGTLHGLFIAGAMMEIHHGWRSGGTVLLCAFAAKLTYEQSVGSLPGTTQMSGGSVIVDAHLYGAVAGLLFGLGWFLRKKRVASSSV